jgi:plastocyanin
MENPNPTPQPLQPSSKDTMPKLLLSLLLIVVVIAIGLALLVRINAPTGTATIQITSKGFEPATLKIKTGTKVTWNNTDSQLHQIASNPYPANSSLPGLSSGGLEPGQSYSYVFTKTGDIGYHDQKNPLTRLGQVDVTK